MVKVEKRPKNMRIFLKFHVALAGTLLNGARGVWINQKIVERAAPEQLIELWGFEGSPYTRVVRGVLTELELPFKFHNM